MSDHVLTDAERSALVATGFGHVAEALMPTVLRVTPAEYAQMLPAGVLTGKDLMWISHNVRIEIIA